jgi:hypothetical protein
VKKLDAASFYPYWLAVYGGDNLRQRVDAVGAGWKADAQARLPSPTMG